MNSKELVMKALYGEKTERIPAGVHGWGMYKFALKGILSDYSGEKDAWKIHGEKLADIEIHFQETFKPDYIHCAEAFFESKKEIINDEQYVDLLGAVRKLESKKVIDELLDIVYLNQKELVKKKKFDHVGILSEKYGDEVFIFLVTEGPLHDIMDEDGILGFERGMIAIMENPGMFVYLAEGMYERQLNFARALKNYGAHGYSQSASYVTADLISPDIYKNLVFPLQRDFYREVDKLGIFPIIAF